MCVSDWRLGRQISVSHQSYDMTAATGLTFNRDPQRVGLTVCVHIAAPSVNSAVKLTFTNGAFIIIGVGLPTLHLTTMTHGSLVTLGGTLSALTLATLGDIIFYTLPESIIAAGFDEFKRQYPTM